MNWKAWFKRKEAAPAPAGVETHMLAWRLAQRIESLKPGQTFNLRAQGSNRVFTILAQEDFEYVLERAGMRTVDLDSDSSP